MLLQVTFTLLFIIQLKILIRNKDGQTHDTTLNVVYKEVFNKLRDFQKLFNFLLCY